MREKFLYQLWRKVLIRQTQCFHSPDWLPWFLRQWQPANQSPAETSWRNLSLAVMVIPSPAHSHPHHSPGHIWMVEDSCHEIAPCRWHPWCDTVRDVVINGCISKSSIWANFLEHRCSVFGLMHQENPSIYGLMPGSHLLSYSVLLWKSWSDMGSTMGIPCY